MILYGALINGVAIIIGGVVGVLAKKGIPERFGNLIVNALGLFTAMLGIMFTIGSKRIEIVVFSLIIGAFIGEAIDIEKRLDNLGNAIQNKFKGLSGNFSQGFVTSSLLFCTGSMAIMGSLQSGLLNDHRTLLTKAIMDGVLALIFASTMGIGVAASAISIILYEGALTLLAASVSGFLTDAVITEMSAAGGVLLFGLALSILDIKKIKIGNLLPAIFIPIILMMFL